MEQRSGQSGSWDDRLARIEARLAALERLLGAGVPIARGTPPVDPMSIAQPVPPPPATPPPVAPKVPMARPADPWLGGSTDTTSEPRPTLPSKDRILEWVRSHERDPQDASSPPRATEKSLEQLLGLGGALWAGAGVLLLGVIFALAYAWDQGWLRPSPTARVIAAFSAGALLHLAGWWLRVRRGFIPFAGVAHGLATAVIVLTSVAAYAAFRAGEAVLPVEGAIVGAWIGVVGGLMVTYAWGLTTPGVVAVIAAMLWPTLLGSDIGSGEMRLVHVFIGALAAGAVSILRPRHALLLGLALTLVPVAARNYAVTGGFYLTTSQFGPNFYIGNNPAADGTYMALRPGRGAPEFERQDATELAERALGRALTPGEVSTYWSDQALAFITVHFGWLYLWV
ncbi:MAG TPA: DUF2339 domain-containing protein, partial [Tepidisphaeraceae bacterium]|nr:DUF2339 domain-containing protein [Tepidisphaeraceae bacterium]